jgi:hypothetical protein
VGRDETTLARALYATPLRLDSTTGAVRPGLCSGWAVSPDHRRWSFICRRAPAIAAALQRLGRLRTAPLHWAFADTRIRALDATRLVVRLPWPWRRFPSVLTAAGTAPRSIPGPFRLVSGSPDRVVVRRRSLTVVFWRLAPRTAVRAFRRGQLDEAPIPVGDVRGTTADSFLGGHVRVRRLLGIDAVVFHGLGPGLRRAYWATANRADYEQLVPELDDSSAFGLLAAGPGPDPARYRRALKAIPSLPRVRVRIGVPPNPALRLGAGLLWAQWREAGLGPQLVDEPARRLEGRLRRVLAPYPEEEAIFAQVVLGNGIGLGSQLMHALAAKSQEADLRRLDDVLRTAAVVVPVARVVDARLVSPRLEGWREDALGDVDYSSVRSRASSRRR